MLLHLPPNLVWNMTPNFPKMQTIYIDFSRIIEKRASKNKNINKSRIPIQEGVEDNLSGGQIGNSRFFLKPFFSYQVKGNVNSLHFKGGKKLIPI